jgi:DNA-binding SARP family transcriptional activator
MNILQHINSDFYGTLKATFCPLIIVLFFVILPFCGRSSGVEFVDKPKGTILNLFKDQKIHFKEGVELSFELQLLKSEQFGQIVIFDGEKSSFSFAYINPDNGKSGLFVFNSLAHKTRYIEIPADPGLMPGNTWIPVRIHFDFVEDQVKLSVNNQIYTLQDAGLKGESKANFIFGTNKKSIIDVPHMIIRNIGVKDDKGKIDYFFPLNESAGTIVHEAKGKIEGQVLNNKWAICSQYYWKLVAELDANAASGVTIDPDHNEIVIVDSTRLIRCNYIKGSFTSGKMNVVKPITGHSGEAFYDVKNDKIYFYNLTKKGAAIQPFLAEISGRGKLIKLDGIDFDNPLHHHANVYFAEYNKYIIFGGYGNFRYSNTFYQLDTDSSRLIPIDMKGDRINPRMHTVAGISDSVRQEFYLLGGVGNEIGRQELGKEFYIDLYKINLKENNSKRLWSIDVAPQDLFIPTRGLIYKSEEECLYALCLKRTSSEYYLYRIGEKDGSFRIVSSPIKTVGNSIKATAYLFFDRKTSRFYAVTRSSVDNSDKAGITIYSLNTPPVTYEALVGSNIGPGTAKKWKLLSPLITVILFLAGIVSFLGYRYLNARKPVAKDNDNPAEARNNPTTNSVYLFGEFKVFDRKGFDISYRFSAKIRQVFILILLYPDQEKGISTEALSTALWSDRSPSSAKNIRGVTINNLRSVLTDIDHIELVYEHNHWKFIYGEQFYCDYLSALALSKRILTSEMTDLETSRQFISILSKGALLPSFVYYDWFDKQKISNEELFNQAIEKMLPYFYSKKLYKETNQLADILFSIDNLSQIALSYKTKALKKLGKYDLAHAALVRYQTKYKELYGTEN